MQRREKGGCSGNLKHRVVESGAVSDESETATLGTYKEGP